MRHADFGTTIKFHVGNQAVATAEMLYQAMGNDEGNGTGSTSLAKNSISIS